MARPAEPSGFQDSAGLVRHMEVSERRNLKLHPLVAIIVPLALLAIIVLLAVILAGG